MGKQSRGHRRYSLRRKHAQGRVEVIRGALQGTTLQEGLRIEYITCIPDMMKVLCQCDGRFSGRELHFCSICSVSLYEKQADNLTQGGRLFVCTGRRDETALSQGLGLAFLRDAGAVAIDSCSHEHCKNCMHKYLPALKDDSPFISQAERTLSTTAAASIARSASVQGVFHAAPEDDDLLPPRCCRQMLNFLAWNKVLKPRLFENEGVSLPCF